MPQNAQSAFIAKTTGTTTQAQLTVGKEGALLTASGGSGVAFNLTAATVVKTGVSRVARVSVIVAGSAAGAIYDAASTSGNTAANQLAAIPNTVGVYSLELPATNGIVAAPGTGQTLVVSYL